MIKGPCHPSYSAWSPGGDPASAGPGQTEDSARLFGPLQSSPVQSTQGAIEAQGAQVIQPVQVAQVIFSGPGYLPAPIPLTGLSPQGAGAPLTPDMAALIQAAVQHGIAEEMQCRTSSWVTEQSKVQGELLLS